MSGAGQGSNIGPNIGSGMRFLKVAVVVMGVLIVLGTTTLVVVAIQRLGAVPAGAPAGAAVGAAGAAAGTAVVGTAVVGTAALDEPAGTRITAMAPVAGGLALSLSGGGEGDRVVVIDPASGRVVARIGLGH